MNIGVISDTHGLLRPEALDALRGSERILHAGDIGTPAILAELETIAPVTAIRGNNDYEEWAKDIAEREIIECEGARIFMLHDRKELNGVAEDYDVVIAGHSHKPSIEERDGVLYVNPGSAGPRRFSLPVSVARLTVKNGKAEAEIIELKVAPPKRRGRK
ncbi:MAG TPA: metallophosphoesterase family protein [Gammaproteobacteria bacterium]